MKRIILFLFFLSAVLLVGCGSDPEVVEEPDTSVALDPETEGTTEPDTGAEPDAGAMLAEDLSGLQAEAEASLVKAGEVGAGEYFPSEYEKATTDLDEGISQIAIDTDVARALLISVKEQGETLYSDSLAKLADEYRSTLERLDGKLVEQSAPEYLTASYNNTVEMRSELEQTLTNGDIALAYDQYRTTYQAMSDLSDALANDIAWINILIRDTETYLADAEEAEAFIYAEEELNMANQYYLAGVKLFGEYNLKDAESELLYAKFYARKAAYSSGYSRKISETDELMLDVMEAIEDASQLTVVDEDGNILAPEPWDGDKALEEKPLADLEAESEEEELPESNLQSDKVPVDGTDGVMGETDEEDENYLETAKELWERGVDARNSGDLELAEQYFLQAKIFVEAYESSAVTQVYTVQWREEDTDCLWRIAGYDSIYDNPFLWPKIWRRNKKMIQNPDLIFPGQVLVIPPQ